MTPGKVTPSSCQHHFSSLFMWTYTINEKWRDHFSLNYKPNDATPHSLNTHKRVLTQNSQGKSKTQGKHSSLSATFYGQSLTNIVKDCTFTLFKQRAGLVYTRKCPHSSVATVIVELLVNTSEKKAPFSSCCKPFASGNPWSIWLGQHFTKFSFQSLSMLQTYQFSLMLVSIGINSRTGMTLITSQQI